MNDSMVAIIGTGHELGSEVVTNAELCDALDTSHDWIVERTGISERRRAADDEFTSTLGAKAAVKAMLSAGIEPQDIDAIICATITPDFAQMPSTACLIQAEIGAKNAFAFDMAAACSGFIYGLDVAACFVASGKYRNVLLVGSELMTRFVDDRDLATRALFADGAGAVIVSISENGRGILASELGSDGLLSDYIQIPAGGSRRPASRESVNEQQHFMKMRGRELFRMAVRKMSSVSRSVLTTAGFDISDIKLIIPHQANQRIIDAVADDLEVSRERFFSNVAYIGNTSAASIPIALDQCVSSGYLQRDDLVLFTAFGGGVTWGATLMRW